MFSSNKKDKKSTIQKNGTLNILGEGTVVEGKIISSGSLRIDGEVRGSVESEGQLFIAESAYIDGDLHCNDAEICGKIVGNIYSTGIISVKESGNIKGDINYNNIEIEPGAQLTCNLKQVSGKLEKVTPVESSNEKGKKGSKIA